MFLTLLSYILCITFTNSPIDLLIKSMIDKSFANRPSIQELIIKFSDIYDLTEDIDFFKKDKEFVSKIKRKYFVPRDWQAFINSYL